MLHIKYIKRDRENMVHTDHTDGSHVYQFNNGIDFDGDEIVDCLAFLNDKPIYSCHYIEESDLFSIILPKEMFRYDEVMIRVVAMKRPRKITPGINVLLWVLWLLLCAYFIYGSYLVPENRIDGITIVGSGIGTCMWIVLYIYYKYLSRSR